jgi:hypothetical protein
MKTLSFLLLGLMACSESLVPTAGPPGVNNQQPGEPNGTGPANGPSGELPPAPPTNMAFTIEEGQSVKLSGLVSHSGTETGNLVIQVLRVSTGNPPQLLHSESIDKAGPFTIQAPSDLGQISLMAFMDLDGNGQPSEDDIGARSDLNIQSIDLSDLNLVLGDIELLGDLVPGRLLPAEGPEATDASVPSAQAAPAAPAEEPAETE